MKTSKYFDHISLNSAWNEKCFRSIYLISTPTNAHTQNCLY